MVKTRSNQCNENETILQNRIIELEKENESLLKQIKLIESEFDELKSKVPKSDSSPKTITKKKNKNKKRHAPLQEQSFDNFEHDIADTERKIYNDILNSIISDYYNVTDVHVLDQCFVSPTARETEKQEPTNLTADLSSHQVTIEAPLCGSTEQHPMAPKSPDIKIIGTSMVRDMGSFCHRKGLRACSFAYPGARIQDITNNIHSYLSCDKQPNYIVIHAGGNDLETTVVANASFQMDSLISQIKRICPSSKILLSAITPRKQNGFLNLKIAKYNELLQLKANHKQGIFFIDCVPLNLSYYKADRIHFNDDGKEFFAERLSNVMKCENFHDNQKYRRY
jgi:hypothetical protein